MSKFANAIMLFTKRKLKMAFVALLVAGTVVPFGVAMAQGHRGSGAHGGAIRGGAGGFRGGYGGFRGYGRPGFGFYLGDPYLDWPNYYGFPYYPYPYGYYYPYPDNEYPYRPQAPTGSFATAPERNWYYCDSPQGYYPYVPSCDGPWHEVSPPPIPPRPSTAPSADQ